MSRLFLGLFLAVSLLSGAGGVCAHAQDSSQKAQPQDSIKAAMLVKFTKFVYWPEETFKDEKTPLIIGIFAAKDFVGVVDKTIMASKTERPILVRSVSIPEEAMKCHVVYFGYEGRAHEKEWIQEFKKQAILTVSDNDDTEGIINGSVLQFCIKDKKVRFYANWEAMKNTDLKISALMLEAALKVYNSPQRTP